MIRNTAIRLHKKLWGWLADNPTLDKFDWPEWSYNGGRIKAIDFDCFACEECKNEEGFLDCEYCMIDWNNGKTDGAYRCEDEDSIYDLWIQADNSKDRSKYAKIIQNLPIKDKE